MAKQEETGHINNVAKFDDLISQLIALAEIYNPPAPELQIAAMQQQLSIAKNSMLQVDSTLATYKGVVDKNEIAYEPLGKIITRSINLFRAVVKNPIELDSAESLAGKVRGFDNSGRIARKAKKAAKSAAEKAVADGLPPIEAPLETTVNSQSRRSFDSINGNLNLYINILANNEAYKPNESDLSTLGLKTLLTSLESKSTEIGISLNLLSVARANRNKALYADPDGMVDVGTRSKKYVKAVLPPEHNLAKRIAGITFKVQKA